MLESFLEKFPGLIKEYWFLITLAASVLVTLLYMLVYRVSPWDQYRTTKLKRDRVLFHNGVGYELLESGYFPQALSEFEESLKLSPEDQAALNGKYLANLFIGLDSPGSDPAFGYAVQRHLSQTNPSRQEQSLHVLDKYLGDLHRQVENIPKATEYYKSALRRKPDYPNALLTMGWHYYEYEQSNVDGMEKMFRQLTSIAPYDHRGFHGLGYSLYMKALDEKDPDKRSSLMQEAAEQSGHAKDLSFHQLGIVMDFGEVARSTNPALSLAYHEYALRILDDPKLKETGDNPHPLLARLLTGDGQVTIDGEEAKRAWIEYQTALDYLALQRLEGGEEHQAKHAAHYERAKELDLEGVIRHIYDDQLRILDRLLPEPDVGDATVEA